MGIPGPTNTKLSSPGSHAETFRKVVFLSFWLFAALALVWFNRYFVLAEWNNNAVYKADVLDQPHWIRAYAISMMPLLTLAFAALVVLVCSFIRRLWVALSAMTIAFIFAQCVLIIDYKLYTIYSRHLIWDDLGILKNADFVSQMGFDAAYVRAVVVTMARQGAMFAGVAVACGFAARAIAKHQTTCRILQGSLFRFKTAAILFACVIVVDRAIYAYLSYKNIPLIQRIAASTPFYPDWGIYSAASSLAKRDVAAKQFDAKVTELMSTLPPGELGTNNSPGLVDSGAIKNVLLIEVESLGKRFATPQVMPNLARFASNSANVICEQHFAAGNATLPSVFSLMFAEPPARLTEYGKRQVGAPISKHLLEKGFKLHVASPYLWGWGKLEQCAFLGFDHAPLKKEHYSEDPRAVQAVTNWLRQPGRQFVYLEVPAPHFPYYCPPEHKVFLPEAPEDVHFDWSIEHVQAHKGEVLNRYLNSLHYSDEVIGQVLMATNLRDTVVIVTGDHGQEFFEHGRITHGTAFDDEQLLVPMIMYVPGLAKTNITSLTSHLDVMPTIAHLLDLQGMHSDFGQSFFSASPHKSVLVAQFSFKASPRYCVIGQENKTDFLWESDHFRLVNFFDRADHSLQPSVTAPGMDSTFAELASTCQKIERCNSKRIGLN